MILVGNKIDLEHCREVDVKLAEAFACDHKVSRESHR